MDQIAFHLHEMTRNFEAGRFASARWHCRIWTRLVAGVKFSNGGTGAPGLRNSFAQACHHPIKKELPGLNGEGN